MDVLGQIEWDVGRANSVALGPLERTFGRVNATVFRQVNRVRPWYQLPRVPALLNLRALRDDLRLLNLYSTDEINFEPASHPGIPQALQAAPSMSQAAHLEPSGAERFPGSGPLDARVLKPRAGRPAARPKASRG